MTEPTIGADELRRLETEDPFPRAMASVTEQAQTEAQRDVVMNALYDVFVGVGDDDGEDLSS